MTFYDVLGVDTDVSTEELATAIKRQQSALADGAVYPGLSDVDGEQLRQARTELVEEAASVLLDSANKAAYDRFLTELGEVAGHLEYLRWQMHPAHEHLPPGEWIERYADAEPAAVPIEQTRRLSPSEATHTTAVENTPTPSRPEQRQARGDTDGDNNTLTTTTTPPANKHDGEPSPQGAAQTGSKLVVPFKLLYTTLSKTLLFVIGITVFVLTFFRSVGSSLSTRGAGVAALAFPFVFLGLWYGTTALAAAVPGIMREPVFAGGVLLIILVHLLYILTPRAGLPIFAVFAAAGYFGAAEESIALTYVYLPCGILALVAFFTAGD